MTRITPTDDQLRQAWRRARRWTWPPTFEESMADPVRAAIVRSDAVRAELRARRPQPPQPRLLVRQKAEPAAPPAPRQAALFDRKRAAAGEHEDDE